MDLGQQLTIHIRPNLKLLLLICGVILVLALSYLVLIQSPAPIGEDNSSPELTAEDRSSPELSATEKRDKKDLLAGLTAALPQKISSENISVSSEDIAGVTRYTSTEHNFSFEIPKTWKPVTSSYGYWKEWEVEDKTIVGIGLYDDPCVCTSWTSESSFVSMHGLDGIKETKIDYYTAGSGRGIHQYDGNEGEKLKAATYYYFIRNAPEYLWITIGSFNTTDKNIVAIDKVFSSIKELK